MIKLTVPEQGTPQGAVLSPLALQRLPALCPGLVGDQWRQRHTHCDMVIVRYADDFVVGFEYREDALAFRAALEERLRAFGLALFAEKTRLIEFGRHAAKSRKGRGDGKPETFDFLGFTHICAKDRKGRFQLRRKTRRKRMGAKLGEIKRELLRRRHQPIAEQGRWLASVVRGYFAYFAVPTNAPALNALSGRPVLAESAPAPQPERPHDLEGLCQAGRALASASDDPPSLAVETLLRQIPEAGARCISSARRDLVRQANWQKVGGASPPERRSNRTTFLREPCVGSREGAGEASVAAWMGRAIEHRKSDGPGCRGFQIGRRQYRRRRFGEMSASPAVSENPCTFARLLLGPWEVFKLPRLS